MAGWGAGEQGLASAAGRPMRVGGELGHAYGIRLLRRTGWSVRHAAARCGIGGTVAGIIGIAVPAIAYAASAGWRAAGGLGMAFQHYRMRGRGDGMRVFRVDLRRIAMEGCGLVRGQKRRKRRCHAGTYDISRSEFEQTCKRLPDRCDDLNDHGKPGHAAKHDAGARLCGPAGLRHAQTRRRIPDAGHARHIAIRCHAAMADGHRLRGTHTGTEPRIAHDRHDAAGVLRTDVTAFRPRESARSRPDLRYSWAGLRSSR